MERVEFQSHYSFHRMQNSLTVIRIKKCLLKMTCSLFKSSELANEHSFKNFSPAIDNSYTKCIVITDVRPPIRRMRVACRVLSIVEAYTLYSRTCLFLCYRTRSFLKP